LLRVLDALTPEEVDELGKWHLDKARSEGIVDRLAADLGERRQVVYEVLGRCLQFDLWKDRLGSYEAAEQAYRQCGERDADIEKMSGRPPRVYAFVHHRLVHLWTPDREDYSISCIENNHWGAIVEGYLIAKGRAFPTTLSLLEATVREQWPKWQVLWRWF
jgi:hypothetical protein